MQYTCPLLLAVKLDFMEIALMCLKHGSNVNIKNQVCDVKRTNCCKLIIIYVYFHRGVVGLLFTMPVQMF